MKKNKFFLILILSFLLITILSSHVFVIAEADHDCIGEGCSICQTVQVIENNLKNVIGGISIISSLIALVFAMAFSIGNESVCQDRTTPITLKVKLTN